MKNSSPVISLYKIALGLAVSSALTVGGLLVVGNPLEIGPFLISFFVMLAIGFRGAGVMKNFSYTSMILAVVTTALYYPGSFIEWKGFKLSALVTPVIQVTMVSMGTLMSFNDFAGVVRMPRGVLIGVSSHFLVMPLIGYALAKSGGFPPEIAAGMILIGCSPNGVASNVIAYLAKANLALSITITAVSTLLAPIIIPLLMKWLTGAFVEIKVLDMMLDMIRMVILPVLGGLLVNKFLSGRPKWLDKAVLLVSMLGIGFITAIITAAGCKSLLAIGPLLLLLVLIHNLSGFTVGYWLSRLCRMSERDCRTVAIEMGMQNGGLASALVRSMGRMATLELVPAIFSPLIHITGSILASWWQRRPPDDKDDALIIHSSDRPADHRQMLFRVGRRQA